MKTKVMKQKEPVTLQQALLPEIEQEQMVVPTFTQTAPKFSNDDDRKVKGIFKNLEFPGFDIKFCFKVKKGQPIVTYHMYDNETYEVPISVADHLNNDCSVPIDSHILDAKGMPSKMVGKKFHRFAFQPLSFA